MNYPETFQKLVDLFKLLPGVGEKTAERYVFSILNLSEDKIQEFGNNIITVHKNLSNCPICGCLMESNKCMYCGDKNRKNDIICVVENEKNVFILEKSKILNVKYHVLGGLISPMEGINPENLSINKLIDRIDNENIKEIILALRPGIEGNTTALYIKKILQDKNIRITQIAQGVPIGTDMEYIDSLTLELALENRSEIS